MDAVTDALADALADDSVKASVNSTGTHSGQYVAKGFGLFDAISTRWNEDTRSAWKRNTE
ncbi:MAG: hypothetical protein GY847_27800 [Proteobacteria bacterium]|nr:hypothetical protein [Pseudomonadota bacterium]